ncbi:MAG: hypothetical protein M1833_006737 [Piccolia ochrophora]|nr:MAG: hypothetical protein M1833_006737 [Piccolia ochrophora]
MWVRVIRLEELLRDVLKSEISSMIQDTVPEDGEVSDDLDKARANYQSWLNSTVQDAKQLESLSRFIEAFRTSKLLAAAIKDTGGEQQYAAAAEFQRHDVGSLVAAHHSSEPQGHDVERHDAAHRTSGPQGHDVGSHDAAHHSSEPQRLHVECHDATHHSSEVSANPLKRKWSEATQELVDRDVARILANWDVDPIEAIPDRDGLRPESVDDISPDMMCRLRRLSAFQPRAKIAGQYMIDARDDRLHQLAQSNGDKNITIEDRRLHLSDVEAAYRSRFVRPEETKFDTSESVGLRLENEARMPMAKRRSLRPNAPYDRGCLREPYYAPFSDTDDDMDFSTDRSSSDGTDTDLEGFVVPDDNGDEGTDISIDPHTRNPEGHQQADKMHAPGEEADSNEEKICSNPSAPFLHPNTSMTNILHHQTEPHHLQDIDSNTHMEQPLPNQPPFDLSNSLAPQGIIAPEDITLPPQPQSLHSPPPLPSIATPRTHLTALYSYTPPHTITTFPTDTQYHALRTLTTTFHADLNALSLTLSSFNAAAGNIAPLPPATQDRTDPPKTSAQAHAHLAALLTYDPARDTLDMRPVETEGLEGSGRAVAGAERAAYTRARVDWACGVSEAMRRLQAFERGIRAVFERRMAGDVDVKAEGMEGFGRGLKGAVKGERVQVVIDD